MKGASLMALLLVSSAFSPIICTPAGGRSRRGIATQVERESDGSPEGSQASVSSSPHHLVEGGRYVEENGVRFIQEQDHQAILRLEVDRATLEAKTRYKRMLRNEHERSATLLREKKEAEDRVRDLEQLLGSYKGTGHSHAPTWAPAEHFGEASQGHQHDQLSYQFGAGTSHNTHQDDLPPLPQSDFEQWQANVPANDHGYGHPEAFYSTHGISDMMHGMDISQSNHHNYGIIDPQLQDAHQGLPWSGYQGQHQELNYQDHQSDLSSSSRNGAGSRRHLQSLRREISPDPKFGGNYMPTPGHERDYSDASLY